MSGPYRSLLICIILCSLYEVCSLVSSTPKKKAPSSIGEAIQHASSHKDLLELAGQFWLPTDDDLPSHLRTQRVHHEKRQRWSAQLLERFASIPEHLPSLDARDRDCLSRALYAASTPFEDDRPEKEGLYIRQALCALQAVAGKSEEVIAMMPQQSLEQLIHRAEGIASVVPLPHAVELRWAARGLLVRMPNSRDSSLSLEERLPRLEQRVIGLPFDIIPKGIDWAKIMPDTLDTDLVEAMRQAIPFNFDMITTRTGEMVAERRGTAWVAEEGIGALAYSGKMMPPKPMPHVVAAAMRTVEDLLIAKEDIAISQPFFDCALCNHYPDGEAACKFHTDPEHGSLWERLTCVVAAGDARRFAFRPVPGQSTWDEWDESTSISGNDQKDSPAVIHLFPGDIVTMFGTCNDDFQHAVYKGSTHGRISLVLKRAINRDGKRGHGLQGQGKRSKRKQAKVTGPTVSVNSSSRRTSSKKRRL